MSKVPAGGLGPLDRLLRRLGGRYAHLLMLAPGIVSGLAAGSATIVYILFCVDATPEQRRVLWWGYLPPVPFALAVDGWMFKRATGHLRAFLEAREAGDPDGLRREVVGLGRATAGRMFVVAEGIAASVILTGAFTLKDPLQSFHTVVATQICVAIFVTFAYLLTMSLMAPVHRAVVAATPTADDAGIEGRWGFLGRKLLFLGTSAQLIPLVFVAAMVFEKTRHLPDVAPVVRDVLLVAAVSMVVYTALNVYVTRSLTRPFSQLAERMQRVVRGDYEVRAHLLADDDVGMLTDQFNRMTAQLGRDRDELERKNHELRAWSETLELRIAERTRELETTRQAAVHAEKMAALGILLAGVGHELNNPLGQITGNSGNLERDLTALAAVLKGGGPVEPALVRRADLMVKAIQNIRKGSERMRTIVRSLEVLSRGSSDPVKRCRILGVVEETVSLVQGDRKWRDVEVVIDVAADLEADVFENGLVQVLINLVVNASQAMDGRGRVTVRAGLDGSDLALSVEDTGPGIPEEHLDKVFAPFFTTKPPGEGTGLGLSIVHDLVVEKHCGSLRASNREGGGARFDVRVPLDLANRYRKAA